MTRATKKGPEPSSQKNTEGKERPNRGEEPVGRFARRLLVPNI